MLTEIISHINKKRYLHNMARAVVVGNSNMEQKLRHNSDLYYRKTLLLYCNTI